MGEKMGESSEEAFFEKRHAVDSVHVSFDRSVGIELVNLLP